MPEFVMVQDRLGDGATDAIIWSFTSLAIIATVIRLYTRFFIVKAVGLDDALILIGQIVAIGLAAIATWHTHILSKSIQLMWLDHQLNNTTYLSGFTTDAIYILTVPFIKCSILAFYKRIAPSRKQRLILYFVALVIIIQAFTCFMLLTFSLDPVTTWFRIFDTLHTIRMEPYYIQITNSAFQVTYDVILLLLPLPIIFKTKFKGHDRAGLIVIYSLSCVSLVATVIRLTKVTMIFDDKDPFLDADQRVDYVYWTVIEVMTAATCANMPAMSSFFRHVLHSTSDKSSTSRLSERTRNLLQTVMRKGTHQSHYDISKREKRRDEEAIARVRASEKSQNIAIDELKLRRNPQTEESISKSQSSLSYQRSISTPNEYISTSFLANLSRRIKYLWSFKKANLTVTDSAATIETASFTGRRSGVIYRTDEFGIERSMV